jgi:hypothetical protein
LSAPASREQGGLVIPSAHLHPVDRLDGLTERLSRHPVHERQIYCGGSINLCKRLRGSGVLINMTSQTAIQHDITVCN